MNCNYTLNLPKELLLLCFHFLKKEGDLGTISLVCRAWQTVAKEDSIREKMMISKLGERLAVLAHSKDASWDQTYKSWRLLAVAYEIGQHIQSIALSKNDKQIVGLDPLFAFKIGPDASRHQTQEGLFLDNLPGTTLSIHTPYGRWSILTDHRSRNWKEVLDKIQQELGLVSQNQNDSLWALTKWKGKQLKVPSYKEKNNYLSAKTIYQIWLKFTKFHPELSPDKLSSPFCLLRF